jgi:acyl carrier protein
MPQATEIQEFILARLTHKISAKGLSPKSLPDRFDLYAEGLIDSLGLLELLSSVEDQFGISVDLQGMSPDELTLLGPLARHMASSFSQAT